MPRSLPIRTFATVGLLAAGLHGHAQAGSSLPATAPTTLIAPLAATPTGTTPGTLTANPPHRATVTFADGLLEVRANNASLHQILRSIARRTGMQIKGGVADDRVFGDYGPATPATILDTLLDGMGVNVLLQEGSPSSPPLLTLTARGGSPTPPIDMQAADADPDPLPPPVRVSAPQSPPAAATNRAASPAQSASPLVQPASSQSVQVPPSLPQPLNNVNGSPNNTTPTASDLSTVQSVPTDSLPTPATAQAVSGIVDSVNPPPPGSTTPPTANQPTGPSTPDSIYQQLLKLQQQKQQQQQAPATPAATPQQ